MGRTAMKALAAVAASIGLLAGASSAYAAPQWSDGLIQKSTITNCASIIFGNPYQEDGAWTWTGQYIDPADPPNVGQPFYIHVVAGAVGNACSGQRVHFELLGTPLPQGLNYAIDPGAGRPVFCYGINWNTNPPSAVQEPAYPAGACPQTIQSGGFQGNPWDAQTNPSDPSDTDPWPLPQGKGWEIQIPVTANRVMSGGFGNCADCNRFMSFILDGNSSPQLFPSQGLFTDNAGTGGGTPGAGGGTGGAGSGLTPNPQRPAPTTPPATATVTPTAAPTSTPPKKCKKGQKLKKGKCVKKKRKKKKK
ncbi:MAG: hypothetical protein ACRDL6_04070 [Solirubrobacterales bacterium]